MRTNGQVCRVCWPGIFPLPYARFNEIRFEELVVLIPPLSYSLPRGTTYSIQSPILAGGRLAACKRDDPWR